MEHTLILTTADIRLISDALTCFVKNGCEMDSIVGVSQKAQQVSDLYAKIFGSYPDIDTLEFGTAVDIDNLNYSK